MYSKGSHSCLHTQLSLTLGLVLHSFRKDMVTSLKSFCSRSSVLLLALPQNAPLSHSIHTPSLALSLSRGASHSRFFHSVFLSDSHHSARLVLIAWSLGKSQSGAVQSCKSSPDDWFLQLQSQNLPTVLRFTRRSECGDTSVHVRVGAGGEGVCVPRHNVYLFTLNPFKNPGTALITAVMFN